LGGLLAVLFWSSCVMWAQRAPNFRVFKAADGLYESMATAITISSNGNVWIRHGSAPQITRFDGYGFMRIPAPEGLGRIYEDASGSLWAGYSEGLQHYDNGQWLKYPIAEVASQFRTNLSGRVRSAPLHLGSSNQIVVLLNDRLLAFDTIRKRISTLLRSSETGVGVFLDLVSARDGGLWIAGDSGLIKMDRPLRGSNMEPAFQEYRIPEKMPVRGLGHPMEDDDGGVAAVGSSTDSTMRVALYFEPQNRQPTLIVQGRVRRCWRGPDSAFWVDSLNALFRLEGTNLTRVETEGTLAGHFHDLVVEPNGVFWLATSEGLVRHAPLLWQKSEDSASGDSPIYALLETPSGELWAVSSQNLFVRRESVWTVYPLPNDLELLSPPAGGLFLSADRRIGLCLSDHFLLLDPRNGQYETIRPPGNGTMRFLGYYRSNLFCIQITSEESNPSAYRLVLSNGRRFYPFPEPLPSPRLGSELNFLRVAGNGDLWLGGSAGVGRLRERNWRYFATERDAPDHAIDMLESRQETIWISTRNRIYEFDGKAWSILRSGFDRINSMVMDAEGAVWVASGTGLLRFRRGSWMLHGREEGLPSEAVYALAIDKKSRYWAGTARGLSRFHPDTDTVAPQIQIQAEKDLDDLVDAGALSFQFTGRDRWQFTVPDRLVYSYRLDAQPWSPYRSVPAATVANLAAGVHRFEVKAMDRNWNECVTPALLEFTVHVPWYREKRLIAISISGLLLILCLAGFAVNRHIRLIHSYAAVEQIVRQRTHELEQAQQALLHSQKMRALGTLAAGIAHDFNSILSIIKGSAQIIEANPEDRDKIRTRIDRIKTSVEQGSAIVKALLGYGREAKQELAPCELNAVVEQTLKLIDDRITEKVQIQFEPTEALPRIVLAKDLLQQMLLNILINASESMAGQGVIHVKSFRLESLPEGLVLAPAHSNRFIAVSVRDHGCGIPQDLMTRIFEPFFTTKAMSTRRGTGLGLSMVFEFAKDQGCGLKVDSVAGEGSTFTLIIPVRE
jgi:signal transduction histidine kinase/ligand-binding sensor domain-containing protein